MLSLGTMNKLTFTYTQFFVLAIAFWAWRVAVPFSKQYFLASRNFETVIDTHGYYYAGNANTSCALITQPEPSDISECEDAAWLADGKLIVACDPARKTWSPILGLMADPGKDGRLWVYEPKTPGALVPVELIGFPKHRFFHPLGIDVFQAKGKQPATIFVANIDIEASVVDVLTISPSEPYKAVYKRTVRHRNIPAPNAIVAVSPTQFYVSIDHRFTSRMPKWIASLTILETFHAPLGWVAFVELLPNNKVKYTTAANFINFANGIALSPDGKEFVAASTYHSVLYFYDRNPKTNKLTYREFIQLPFGPDNVSYDKNGRIVIAGHPNGKYVFEVAYGFREYAPSWILSVTRRKPYPKGTTFPPDDLDAPEIKVSDNIPQNPKYEYKSLYYSSGAQYSGASAAFLLDGDELIGLSLLGPGVLHCTP